MFVANTNLFVLLKNLSYTLVISNMKDKILNLKSNYKIFNEFNAFD